MDYTLFAMKKFFRNKFFSFVVPLSFLAAGGNASAPPANPSMKVAENKNKSIQTQEDVEAAVILGGGVGALTSAIYLGRAGLEPVVVQGPTPGGLLTQSHSVQNWPGEMEIDGHSLTDKIRTQAKANGAHLLEGEVTSVDFSKRPYKIKIRSLPDQKEKELQAETVIVAMGTVPNFLGVEGEKQYWGKGVTNCAICDGSLYKNRVVGVVGGGDAAVLEALYLSNIAKEVDVFVRKSAFKAVEEKRMETLLAKPNVKIFYETAVSEIKGDGEKVTHVVVQKGKEKTSEIPLDGLFLAIGSTPNSQLFGTSLDLDKKGYIQLKKDQQTSADGVYAIGDIVDPIYKQAISAAGDGAKAALQAQQYLADRAPHLVAQIKERAKQAETVVVAAEQTAPKESLLTESHDVIEISSQEQFEQELRNSPVPVVVDFYATWCGPCKQVSPLIESSANQLSGKVKFLKVNVDELFDLSSIYNIQAMPTVLVLDPSGEISDRKVGSQEITELLKQLEKQAFAP